MKTLSNRLLPHAKPSVFQEVQKWIRQHKALDIASGYPTWDTPQFVKDSLINQLQKSEDQYGPPGGQIKFRAKVAEYYQSQFKHTELAPKNVYIGLGAGGILNDLSQAFINPGDEVVLLDPHFPHHYTCPSIYGATVKSVPLIQPPSAQATWQVDFDLLEQTLNEKTKMLWLCSPHNPTGKIFTEQEYQKLAKILEKYPNIIVVSDEVYEFLYYDNKPINRFANISENIARRTITLGSYGKILSCTGWRIGYAIADPEFINGMILATQNGGYCVFRPGQMAMLDCIEKLNQPYKNNQTYLQYTNSQFQQKRDYIQSEFSQIPNLDWEILHTEGGYFTIIDTKNHIPNIPTKFFYKEKYQQDNKPCNMTYNQLDNPEYPADVAFVRYLLEKYKVSILPTSSFFVNPVTDNSLIRLSLAKTEEQFSLALDHLRNPKNL